MKKETKLACVKAILRENNAIFPSRLSDPGCICQSRRAIYEVKHENVRRREREGRRKAKKKSKGEKRRVRRV